MAKLNSVPLSSPTPTSLAPESLVSGPIIPAIERIRLFSDLQWAEFILEWATSFGGRYTSVEKCDGAGDMGRDVIGFLPGPGDLWDNYQCKRYGRPLQPADIWIELGKLVFYTHRGDYTYPRHYAFVGPHGAGPSLSRLLRRPAELKAELVSKWDGHCRSGITSTARVDLSPTLRAHLEALDFSIFSAIPPLRLIEEHASTRWHAARFGGGLPARPPVPQPPDTVAASEANYVRHLLDAYGDHLKRVVSAVADISQEANIREHFQDSRLEFYSAEALRSFSRDTLPPGEFEKLQDEIHSGIRDQVRAPHEDAYRRVVAVVATSKSLQLFAHPLTPRMSVRDRGGVCHQLANDSKLRWIR